MDITAFRRRYPEFDKLGNDLLQATLDEAALELDVDVFGDQWPAAHGALTAHKLTLSPYGQAARMVPKDGVTTYITHFNKLKFSCTQGFRVA